MQVLDSATASKVQSALQGAHRSAEDKARDPQRHPEQTLGFFGLRDDMTVVELWPGGGWYTAVLAPVLREKGKLVVTNFPAEVKSQTPSEMEQYMAKASKKYSELLASNPAVYDKVEVRTVAPPSSLDLGPEGSADLVVTFRNSHGFLNNGIADEVYGAAFRVLKKGGVLGVEQHRASPGQDLEAAHKAGYVSEAELIRTIEAAGFKLAGKSEINANPKDTKDHPDGVWSLPPSLKGGDKDRAKYEAIGESDRMTLKFTKP